MLLNRVRKNLGRVLECDLQSTKSPLLHPLPSKNCQFILSQKDAQCAIKSLIKTEHLIQNQGPDNEN